MTTRNYSILTGLTAAAVMALWVIQPKEMQGGAATISRTSMAAADPEDKISDAKHQTANATSPVTAPPTASLRQRLDSAKDRFALAKQMLPLAQAGNPEAQVVIFQAYRGCTEGGQRDHFKKYDTLEKMRQQAIDYAAYGLSVAQAEADFQRCHGFYTEEAKTLGDPWDWLQKATEAGYAPAQAQTARLRLWQDQMKAQIQAAGGPDGSYTPDPVTLRGPIGGDSTPRELLVAAAQSGDPDVFATIGNEQLMLHPGQPDYNFMQMQIAWTYAACQRGFDCSGYGPASMVNCAPNDHDCTPVPNDFLKQVNNNWVPVQEVVNQINSALAAKQWDKLPGLMPGG